MFAVERSKKILEILQENETVQIGDLAKLLSVTNVTIRKDLKKLEDAGKVIKIHGGAILKKDSSPSNLSEINKISDNINQKKDKLAKTTCNYISKGDTIFLGSGYSCVSFAKQLPSGLEISVITNNIEAISYLKNKCKTLILIGGEVIFHETNFFSSSSEIHEKLKSYNINKAITSCSGIDLDFGISVSNETSKKIITTILENSNNWYLMADSSKFNNILPYKIAELSTPKIIITESISEKYKVFSNIIEC